jgi:hypothetical protein
MFEVYWLPRLARLAEVLLIRDRDRRRAEAMQADVAQIKTVAEAAAAHP